MSAYIMTKDDSLFRLLSLLLEEAQFPLSEKNEASLFLVDLDTVSDRELPATAIGFTRKGEAAPFPVFSRPFDEELFLTSLAELKEGGAPLSLSKTEARLFSLLSEAKGEPVSRRALLIGTFGEAEAENEGLLNVYIHYLRQKLERDGKKRIFAHRGRGYSYKC